MKFLENRLQSKWRQSFEYVKTMFLPHGPVERAFQSYEASHDDDNEMKQDHLNEDHINIRLALRQQAIGFKSE